MNWQQCYWLQLSIISLLLMTVIHKVFNQLLLFANINTAVAQFANIIILISISILSNLTFFQHNFSLTQMTYSLIGNISISSFCYLIFATIATLTLCLKSKIFRLSTDVILSSHHWLAMSMIFLIGLILYLSTLGFIRFDFYSYGFHNSYLLIIVVMLSLLMILQDIMLGYVWTLALISYLFHLLPTNNLWDYLLDPLLWLWSIFQLLKLTVKT